MLTLLGRGVAARRVGLVARRRLVARLSRAAAAAGEEDAEWTLLLTGDRAVRTLNRDYRRIDRSTDVLSFAMREGEGAALGQELLGDVVISVDTAARQAARAGHGLEDELLRLAIHGLAHLCGRDHATPAEARAMFGWEARLREQALGSGPVCVVRCAPCRRP